MPRKSSKRKKKTQKKSKKVDKTDNLEKKIEELMSRIEQLEKRQSSTDQAINQLTDQVINQLAAMIGQLKATIEQNIFPTAEKLINDAKGLVIAIANDSRFAKEIGLQTGINVATLQNTAQRILEGKASQQEILCFIDNIWNSIKGYFVGDQAYKDVVSNLERSSEKVAKKVSERLIDEE